MAKFVLAYTGGGMATSDEGRKAIMEAWGRWFGGLGAALVDGGAPFSESRAVTADGAVHDAGPSHLTGYSIVDADSIDAAVAMARSCPLLHSAGSVEVYAVHAM